MKRTFVAVATIATLAAACLSWQGIASAQAQSPQQPRPSDALQHDQFEARQRAEIVGVLKSYERSLNASDVAGVVQLYTDDAVLLAPGAPSAVGANAVRTAYTGIFQAIDIDLTFQVAEVNVVSADWAFLRSTSTGVVTVLATGAQIPSSNQE